ncbi:hypothetical protein ACFUTV_08400 [Streptomyces sp. NPDC057298]|uniref:hypothetical protein n=1 Tax=Streptomyces sp. NPDC057298 TaxID=3346091 RepID=UPI00362A42E4
MFAVVEGPPNRPRTTVAPSEVLTAEARQDGAYRMPDIGFWQPARTSEQPDEVPVHRPSDQCAWSVGAFRGALEASVPPIGDGVLHRAGGSGSRSRDDRRDRGAHEGACGCTDR